MQLQGKILKITSVTLMSFLVFPMFVFSSYYGETIISTNEFTINETKKEPTEKGIKVEGSIKASKAIQPFIQVAYGDTDKTMDRTGATIANKTPINVGSTQSFSFEINDLQGGKDYYYTYVNGDNQIEGYIPAQKFTTIVGSNPDPDPKNNENFKDKTQTDKDMGLIPCDGSTSNPCKFKHLLELVDNFLQWIIYLTIPLAAIAFAYIGWLYLKSQGSEEARTNAKHIFMNVVIGILFVLGAWLIVNTILDIFVEPYIRDQLFIR
jgi:hypothetical protein